MSGHLREGDLPRVVLLSDREGTARFQMDRDREILGRPSLWRRPLLRLYRIRSGVTVGRSWAGTPPPEWPLPEEGVVVRPTGGGAVLHGTDLCLSLFIPWRDDFPRGQDWPEFYGRLHGWLGEALAAWGIPSTESLDCQCPPVATANTPPGGACFSEPVRGDLMSDGKKILGGALALGREGLLYQGSIAPPEPDPLLSGLFEGWYGHGGEKTLSALLFFRGKE